MVALTSAIKGKFGFIGITSYLIGMIIGSGIYITSNKIFISVGSWGPAILVWIIVGILSMVGALCFAELAAAYPRQGGSYIYIKKELGCFPGFIYVFTRTVMLNPMSQAVMTIACATQVQIAIKPCTNTVPTKFIACCLILLMFWLHSFHAKLITKFNALITFIKVLTIVGVFIVAIVYLAKNRISLTPAFQEVSSQPSDWVSAFNGCYWSYAGWQSLSVVIEEIKNPRKTFPITVVTGVGIVIVAYVLANMSFFIVLTPQEVKSSTFILNTFAAKIAGFSLEVPFSILVFFSLFGSYLGTGLGSGRYIFSAAREGDLPRPLSLLHWKLNTPIPAQATNMILSLIFIVITESIGVLLGLFVFDEKCAKRIFSSQCFTPSRLFCVCACNISCLFSKGDNRTDLSSHCIPGGWVYCLPGFY
ncbi:Y+L amino acid transporter 2 isoform X2 [Eurytemora carolleeae]|uniref:Y+L amino acid transporter 2 isoform X2 n=1 Tax=Eurytemora carolleeae TaxID=1294199 RepID=UPI000C786706|nr:Y+L amino acid transporter 2 isoform X2 [Eurytemora carolleeae]|eukprot:XP_023328685.1 Y+L amino acid transporter 2-like isoform X2 [Eurytemora affinis]